MREVFDKSTTPQPTSARAPSVEESINLANASIGPSIAPFNSPKGQTHSRETVIARWGNPKEWSGTGSRLVGGNAR